MPWLLAAEVSHFNSRSCEGATSWLSRLNFFIRISTHAPVKERHHAETGANRCTHFNSRSCEGATWRRRRRAAPRPHFNSRSCEGATALDGDHLKEVQISTHAPVKERPFERCQHERGAGFQLTLL